MENDLNRRGISSHDNELRDTTVQGLGGLVSTLLKLAQMGGLLDNVEDLLGEVSVSEGESTGVRSRHYNSSSRLVEGDCSWMRSKGSLQEVR